MWNPCSNVWCEIHSLRIYKKGRKSDSYTENACVHFQLCCGWTKWLIQHIYGRRSSQHLFANLQRDSLRCFHFNYETNKVKKFCLFDVSPLCFLWCERQWTVLDNSRCKKKFKDFEKVSRFTQKILLVVIWNLKIITKECETPIFLELLLNFNVNLCSNST